MDNTLNNNFFINNKYYETKNIKYDDLINLNIKLDYNNAYDKFIELI
jgi:hypothetical protein